MRLRLKERYMMGQVLEGSPVVAIASRGGVKRMVWLADGRVLEGSNRGSVKSRIIGVESEI